MDREDATAAVVIRPCRAEDCAEIVRMIRELAEFEKVPEQVKITDQGLCEDGFNQEPFYKCVVAELPPECRSQDGHPLVGYGLYFFTYSTWKGKNIYMEDLYVMPEFRDGGMASEKERRRVGGPGGRDCSVTRGCALPSTGKGIGKKLMSTIAKIGVEKGCTQMKFSVLDWNRSAIDFYLSKGAVDLTAAEGWHVFRFEADAMQRLASEQANQ